MGHHSLEPPRSGHEKEKEDQSGPSEERNECATSIEMGDERKGEPNRDPDGLLIGPALREGEPVKLAESEGCGCDNEEKKSCPLAEGDDQNNQGCTDQAC